MWGGLWYFKEKAPILAFPDFTEAFILDADASSCGLGAVLAQSTRGNGRHYCATRREMLALKDPEGQLAWWLEILGEYHFTVEHRAGNKHSNADVLSRIPCKQCGWQEQLEKPPAKAVVMATEILPQNKSHEVWGWTPAWSPEELRTLQQADHGFYPAIQWLINDTVPVTFPHEGSHAL